MMIDEYKINDGWFNWKITYYDYEKNIQYKKNPSTILIHI